MSGGFFRGTSFEQDTRFSNKQAKLLKTMKFPPELEHLVDLRKVEMDVMKPWIAKRVTELLGFEDEVLINFIYGLLEAKGEVNGKEVQIQLTGFMEKHTGKFMKELWGLLLSAQQNASGVPQQFLDAKEEETRKRKEESDRIVSEIQKRKDKESRELELEKSKKMDGGAGSDEALKPKDKLLSRSSRSFSEEDNEAGATNGFRRRRRRNSRSSVSDHSTSPKREGDRSSSVSPPPKFRNRSFSPERMKRSPRRYHRSLSRSLSPPQPRVRRLSPSPFSRSSSPARRRNSPLLVHRRSPSPARHRLNSPFKRRLRSPRRRWSRSPRRYRSPSPTRRRRLRPPSSPRYRRRSPTPVRRRAASPLRHRSPSPARRRYRSPARHGSPNPSRRRYHSPEMRRSPSPARHSSQSSGQSRSRSPAQSRSPSRLRHGSASPLQDRLQSPVGARIPSLVDRSLSPLRHKRKSSIRRSPGRSNKRSPSPLESRSPSRYSSSPSPLRGMTSSLVLSKSPTAQISPAVSSEGRDGNSGRMSPTHSDSEKQKAVHNRNDSGMLPSPRRGVTYKGELGRKVQSPHIGCQSPRQERSPYESHMKDEKSMTAPRGRIPLLKSSPLKATEEEEHQDYRDGSFSRYQVSSGPKTSDSPQNSSGGHRHDDNDLKRKDKGRSENASSMAIAALSKSPTKDSAYDERLKSMPTLDESKADIKNSLSHDARGRIMLGKPKNALKSNKKDQTQISSVDLFQSEGSDKHRVEVGEKRKHKRSSRKDISSEGSSFDSDPEERKEVKRRKKEEKRLRKEERRQRREDRRRRREEKRANKRKRKPKESDSPVSDIEKNRNDLDASDGRHNGTDKNKRRSRYHSTEDEESELEKKKLEIELREKALQSIRAKKGIDH